MPRKPGKVPAYSLHKASGQAVVRLDLVDHYLGPYGSPESHERYQRAVAVWSANRCSPAASSSHGQLVSSPSLTVKELCALYWQFAKTYYVEEQQIRGEVRVRRPTGELPNLKYAIRSLLELYSTSPAWDFGPLALKALQRHLIATSLCRRSINARVDRVKRIFKWGVSEQLVPPAVYEGLRTASGLRFGRSSARETAPVRPVDDASVDAVLPFVSSEVGTMIQLQRLTGMRPGEVVLMRSMDIDRSGDVWVYEPHCHKNSWRGYRRLIPLGPQAQAVLQPFTERPAREYLFSPARAEQQRNAKRRSLRRTPMTPSQARRKGKEMRKRAPQDRFDVHSYRRAIARGIQQAGKAGVEIEHWHPNQLRHSRATEIRKSHGIEAAQVTLGHARADTTQIYAERNLELAITIARRTG